MELLVFDLDGTLLNAQQQISAYTQETLQRLQQRNIPYTIATGRTIHAAKACIEGINFPLLHAYNNGVALWSPQARHYIHHRFLTLASIDPVLQAFAQQNISPFIFAVEPDGQYAVYHAPPKTATCQHHVTQLEKIPIQIKPLNQLHPQAQITNINATGNPSEIQTIHEELSHIETLLTFTGGDMYKQGFHWLDIHHSAASKGSAITLIKQQLNIERVICFGDNDNDISMFHIADEAYAPENALDEVKTLATAIIGHHDEDGIARFLRQHYQL